MPLGTQIYEYTLTSNQCKNTVVKITPINLSIADLIIYTDNIAISLYYFHKCLLHNLNNYLIKGLK